MDCCLGQTTRKSWTLSWLILIGNSLGTVRNFAFQDATQRSLLSYIAPRQIWKQIGPISQQVKAKKTDWDPKWVKIAVLEGLPLQLGLVCLTIVDSHQYIHLSFPSFDLLASTDQDIKSAHNKHWHIRNYGDTRHLILEARCVAFLRQLAEGRVHQERPCWLVSLGLVCHVPLDP